MIAAVWQYIRSHEAYSLPMRYRYDAVSAMSVPTSSTPIRDRSRRQPRQPQLKFGRHGQVDIDEIGIFVHQAASALVRFWRTYHPDVRRDRAQDMVGDRRLRARRPMPANTRLIDPAGLKIVTICPPRIPMIRRIPRRAALEPRACGRGLRRPAA